MTAMSMIEYGKLPALRITADDGAQAIVTLYGAHLVSWKSADGKERLFCSARSALDGSRAIRGGVPIIFPQFSERGPGMRHGFARVSTWRHGAGTGAALAGEAQAAFFLDHTDLPPALAQGWPHPFALALNVAVRANELQLTLDVHNIGAQPFAFSAALHTYFLVDRLDRVAIGGVQQGTLALNGKLDKICLDVGGDITLRDGSGALALEQSGFHDAVVWNPGAADAAALADMDDAEYQRFVCIEPALIAPLMLAGGAGWRGWHKVSARA